MTGTALKFVMAMLMVLDHISIFVSPHLAGIFHLITRPVAPIFGYLAMEGYIHTGDRKKYLLRLYISAAIMFLGSYLINSYVISNPEFYIHNNIFFTLALGVTALLIYDKVQLNYNKFLGIILLTTIIVIAMYFAEGGVFVVPFMLIAFVMKDKPKVRNTLFITLSIIMIPSVWQNLGNFNDSLNLFFTNSDVLMFAMSLPFIYIYNGERGKNTTFTKYLFYVFYPAHIWLINILGDKLM